MLCGAELETPMNISRNDALAALNDVERAEARSLDARVYRTSGVQLISWGVIWMIGYGVEGLQPRWAAIAWPVLVMAGVVFNFAVVRLRGIRGRAVGWRWAVTALSIILFFWGTYTVFRVSSPGPAAAFPALVMAFAYAVAGGWRFTRFLFIAAALFVLTMVGFFYLRPVFEYWLAAVGGGALVLGGVWLMKA